MCQHLCLRTASFQTCFLQTAFLTCRRTLWDRPLGLEAPHHPWIQFLPERHSYAVYLFAFFLLCVCLLVRQNSHSAHVKEHPGFYSVNHPRSPISCIFQAIQHFNSDFHISTDHWPNPVEQTFSSSSPVFKSHNKQDQLFVRYSHWKTEAGLFTLLFIHPPDIYFL